MSADHGPVAPEASVSYLARDYDSFLSAMLQRMDSVAPQWRDRSGADGMIAVIEVLAYAADYLAYYQDAVATEAYLDTARLRSSVRRHAQLLGYTLQDGCSARVWIHVQVDDAQDADARVELPAGTTFEAGTAHARRQPGAAAPLTAVCFESIETAVLRARHNTLRLAADLPAGATSATLASSVKHLQPGMPVALGTGDAWQVVHLAASTDAAPTTELEWEPADALVRAVPADTGQIFGNLVLADHGLSLEVELAPVPERGSYRPVLPVSPLARADRSPRLPSATRVARSDPRRATPQISLRGGGTGGYGRPRLWSAVPSLIGAGPDAAVFCVEQEDDGRCWLLFGGAGAGARPDPGSEMSARVRLGGGTRGNIGPGAEFIVHAPASGQKIVRAWNPVAAAGGVDAESIDQAKVNARAAVKRDWRLLDRADIERCVLDIDGVAQARARRLADTSTGPAYVVTVVASDAPPWSGALTPELERAVQDRLAQRKIMGSHIALRAAVPAPIKLHLGLRKRPGYRETDLERAVRDALVGPQGLFRNRPRLGDSIHFSRVAARVRLVPGVAAVKPVAFCLSSESTVNDEVVPPTPAGAGAESLLVVTLTGDHFNIEFF